MFPLGEHINTCKIKSSEWQLWGVNMSIKFLSKKTYALLPLFCYINITFHENEKAFLDLIQKQITQVILEAYHLKTWRCFDIFIFCRGNFFQHYSVFIHPHTLLFYDTRSQHCLYELFNKNRRTNMEYQSSICNKKLVILN